MLVMNCNEINRLWIDSLGLLGRRDYADVLRDLQITFPGDLPRTHSVVGVAFVVDVMSDIGK